MSLKDALEETPKPDFWECDCGESRFQLWETGAVTCSGCGKEAEGIQVVAGD